MQTISKGRNLHGVVTSIPHATPPSCSAPVCCLGLWRLPAAVRSSQLPGIETAAVHGPVVRAAAAPALPENAVQQRANNKMYDAGSIQVIAIKG